ncbi:TIGR00730 family Rossman fold protein [Rhodococcus sp. TAF43]|uniref:LOG family protein n=1 Tax=unclassified Rhodococcus (in: high G+C Gram-positive bacteria) TaxID=192944 RepID=UPI0015829615|nr:TIGR00730 family Rossman fold protein [Rhodococcus sp. W8901]QKT13624.1 TIGR00730 family Rossman fold protein [Rhodococcus sp. W8901]
MRITAFMGSATGHDPAHLRTASAFGTDLAAAGIGLVYGGGRVGLMGAVADAVVAGGGEAIGVIPRHLADKEIAHPRLTSLEVVESMHARKQRMAALADAFVVLPGGAGTLDEFFEIWTWQQLGLHTKPVFLLDTGGFWQPLVALIDHLVDTGFVGAHQRDALQIAGDLDAVRAAMTGWAPPVPKWTTTSGPTDTDLEPA